MTSQVNIGFLAQTTGTQSPVGADAVRGAQLAADIINKAYPDLAIPFGPEIGLPGLGGATVNIAVADTKGSAEHADQEATTLVRRDHASGLIAVGSAEVAATIGAETTQLRVPVIDAWSNADYLPEMGLDWYFRTVPSDRSLVETLFSLLQRQLGAPTGKTHELVLLTEGDGQSAADLTLVRELSDRAGYHVALALPMGADPDATALAYRIDQAKADVVLVVTADARQATAAAKVAGRLHRALPVIGLGGGFGSLGPETAPSAPALLRTAAWSDEFTERYPLAYRVASLYQRRFDARMTEAAASGFTAVFTLAAAINAAGTVNPASLRASLRNLWLPATQIIMPWDGIRFAANGQNELAAGLIEARVSQRYRVVYPRELAATRVIWITPPELTS